MNFHVPAKTQSFGVGFQIRSYVVALGRMENPTTTKPNVEKKLRRFITQ